MRLPFTVGDHERHEVVFSFNKMWGNLSITVDGVEVTRDFRMFSLRLTKVYELVVGHQERHTVRIEKSRATFFAGFRPQPVQAFVDGRLVAEGVA